MMHGKVTLVPEWVFIAVLFSLRKTTGVLVSSLNRFKMLSSSNNSPFSIDDSTGGSLLLWSSVLAVDLGKESHWNVQLDGKVYKGSEIV